jgi:two-component system response regulator FixJ
MDMTMGSGRTVYILDDDSAVRVSTQFLLEACDMASEAFGSPLAFLAAFDPDRAGCLLLDLHMPEMSGLDVFKALRNRGVSTPVIVMSGRIDPDIRVLLEQLGAMAILSKPADDEELVGLIQRCLKKPDEP